MDAQSLITLAETFSGVEVEIITRLSKAGESHSVALVVAGERVDFTSIENAASALHLAAKLQGVSSPVEPSADADIAVAAEASSSQNAPVRQTKRPRPIQEAPPVHGAAVVTSRFAERQAAVQHASSETSASRFSQSSDRKAENKKPIAPMSSILGRV